MLLRGDSLIIRGGLPDAERWLDSILDAVDEGQKPVLSVFGENRQGSEDILDTIYRIVSTAKIPHSKVAATTPSKVLQLGLNLEHDASNGQSENHFHIVFPAEPSIIEVRALIEVFSEPFQNPIK